MQRVERWLAGSTSKLENLANKVRQERIGLEKEGLQLLFEAIREAESNGVDNSIKVDTGTPDFLIIDRQEFPLNGNYLVSFEYAGDSSRPGWARELHDSAKFLVKRWGYSKWGRETSIFVYKPYSSNGLSEPQIEIDSNKKAIKRFYPFEDRSIGEDWDNVNALDVLRFLNWVVNQSLKQQKVEVAAQLTERP